MGQHYDPPFGLDPDVILKSDTLDKWPRLLLRGIYDVMKRDEKANQGSLMERYRKGFNVVVFGMVKARPPRLVVTSKREIQMVGYGFQREVEVRRGEEAKVTDKKLKEFARWWKQLKDELAQNMPKQDLNVHGGSKAADAAPVSVPASPSGSGSPGVL
jgi:hypothetical protein